MRSNGRPSAKFVAASAKLDARAVFLFPIISSPKRPLFYASGRETAAADRKSEKSVSMNNKSSRAKVISRRSGRGRKEGRKAKEFLHRVSKKPRMSKKDGEVFCAAVFLTTSLVINTPVCVIIFSRR